MCRGPAGQHAFWISPYDEDRPPGEDRPPDETFTAAAVLGLKRG